MSVNPKARRSTSVAIDASRGRSGGARAHLIGILSSFDPHASPIKEIHLWAYQELLDEIPDASWLIKHCPSALSKSLLHQLFWQYFYFHREVAAAGCDITLNTDAGSISRASPSVTMSRDMLSFEDGEIQRYGFTLARLRLEILKHLQVRSLKRSEGALFLTKHAYDTIKVFTGELANYALIPHGIGEIFKRKPFAHDWSAEKGELIRAIYVSPAWRFKHQVNVLRAVQVLRDSGINIGITFVGGGSGKALRDLHAEVIRKDPHHEFVTLVDFVNHQKLPAILAESNCFIFASSCENMPNSLIEAMAVGLPIACSDRGPMPEVLKDGGIYFDPESVQSITDTLFGLVEQPELRSELCQKAYEYSRHYNWKRCGDETWDFLCETLQQQNHHRPIW